MNIVDFFDKRRYWGEHRIPFLNRLHYYSIVNYIVTLIANAILPIYFRLTQHNSKYKLSKEHEKKQLVVVSLTSFPKRLPTLWKTIECILRQTIKPDKIVLYLTESQVCDIKTLPQSLLSLRERGLEIKLCKEEIRSHTKYYQAFIDYPNDIIITVDDDLYYRSDLVESHLKWHEKHPKAIIANWVKEITPTSHLYKDWPDVHIPTLSNRFILLGVSSVLYPPHSLYKDVFNTEKIKELCLTADDIWLSCMAILAKTPIFYTGYQYNHLPILIKNNTTLISVNKERNQVCVDNLNNYYLDKLGLRPFVDILF